jgi:hypothetical protein
MAVSARFFGEDVKADIFMTRSENALMSAASITNSLNTIIISELGLLENYEGFTTRWETFQMRLAVAAQTAAVVVVAANDDIVTSENKVSVSSAGAIARLDAVRVRSLKKQAAAQNSFVGLMNAAGTALFKDNKAIQIGMAIVNTAAGVAFALGSAPPPINFANAAAVAIAGAAQIAAIRSASKGGGSTAPVAAPAPVQAPLPIAPEGGAGGGGARNVNIQLTGSSFGKQEIRDLIDSINEEIGDGANLLVAA